MPAEIVERNGIIYRLRQHYKGHGADDEAYARNDAYFYRKDRLFALVRKTPQGWAVYASDVKRGE